MNEIFQVPATITKIMTMRDKSLRLQVDVERILSPDENAKLFALHDTLGFFIYKDAEIFTEDLDNLTEEKIKTEFKDEKTPSQILRNRLFVYYKKTKGTTDGFENWRINEMNRIGLHYLEKLNG